MCVHIALFCLLESPLFLPQTNPGELVKHKVRVQRKSRIYCFNCAGKGHYGHVSSSHAISSAVVKFHHGKFQFLGFSHKPYIEYLLTAI